MGLFFGFTCSDPSDSASFRCPERHAHSPRSSDSRKRTDGVCADSVSRQMGGKSDGVVSSQTRRSKSID